MYKIKFYKHADGSSPVKEYLQNLVGKTDKNNRIKFHKIRDYIRVLAARGQGAGLPYMKHIEGDLWELRPLRDRIFFVAWENDTFILLHQFMKQSRKTPKREIDTAKRRLEEIRKDGERHD